jgi:hypothetical protein
MLAAVEMDSMMAWTLLTPRSRRDANNCIASDAIVRCRWSVNGTRPTDGHSWTPASQVSRESVFILGV